MYEWAVVDGKRVRIDGAARAEPGEQAVFHMMDGTLKIGTIRGLAGDLVAEGEIIRFPPGNASPLALLFYDGFVQNGAYQIPQKNYYVEFGGFPQVVPLAARVGRVVPPEPGEQVVR